MQLENSRLKLIDAIKGLAIVLMVVGHCIQYGSGNLYLINASYFENIVFKIIYSFHMPLFMLVSGYLFYYSLSKYSFKELIIRRIKQLIVPIITYSIIDNILLCIYNKVIIINLQLLLYNLWFLWALFYSSIAVLIISKFFKKEVLMYVLIGIFTFFIPGVYNFQLYCYMFPYFVLGYLFNKYSLKDRAISKINLIFCVSFVITIVGLMLYNYSSYIYTTGYYILNGNAIKQLLIDLYRFVIGLSGSVSVIIILFNILNVTKLNLLVLIGKNSLGIYIISGLIFAYIFPQFNIYIDNINYMLIILETICVIFSSIIATLIVKKCKIFNKLLLGGR